MDGNTYVDQNLPATNKTISKFFIKVLQDNINHRNIRTTKNI